MPPQDDTLSTAATGSSITAQQMLLAPSEQERTETAQPYWSRCIEVGSVWRSRQNGKVYDPQGIAPTICVGHHAGVEPKIIEYEKNNEVSE